MFEWPPIPEHAFQSESMSENMSNGDSTVMTTFVKDQQVAYILFDLRNFRILNLSRGILKISPLAIRFKCL